MFIEIKLEGASDTVLFNVNDIKLIYSKVSGGTGMIYNNNNRCEGVVESYASLKRRLSVANQVVAI